LTGIYDISVLYAFMNQILDQTVIISNQPVIISLTSLLGMSGPQRQLSCSAGSWGLAPH